jgi:uncharacterized protein (DUF111 family)
MLAACIDAAGNEGENILLGVQSCVQNGLQHLLRDDWCWSTSNRSSQRGAICVLWSLSSSHDGKSSNVNRWSDLRCMLKSGVDANWLAVRSMLLNEIKEDFFPIAVRKVAVDVLQLLVDSHTIVYGEQTSDSEAFREFDLFTSMVSVLATLLAMHSLRIKSTSCSRLPFVEGQISTIQGLMPAVSPLTLELMVGMPISISDQADICVTPTAVALLRVLTSAITSSQPSSESLTSSFTELHAKGVGGSDELAERTCVTRVLLGELLPDASKDVGDPFQTKSNPSFSNLSNSSRWKIDSLVHIEANLDDTTSEYLAFAVELLLKNGAVDAWVAPIVMKKGRSAHTLHCLCFADSNAQLPDIPSSRDKLLEIMFRHTTTLGARLSHVSRAALRRSLVTVQAPFPETSRKGLVDVKVGYLDEEVISIKAEFDHCRKISEETGVPLKDISELAIRLARLHLHLE